MKHDIEMKISGKADSKGIFDAPEHVQIDEILEDCFFTVTINNFHTKVFRRADYSTIDEFDEAVATWMQDQFKKEDQITHD
jgi:hypothetical protein